MKPDELKMQERRALVLAFYERELRVPSFAEMGELFGLKSKNAVSKAVSQLERLGVLKRTGDGRISLGSRALGFCHLGEIGAGFPSPAEEELSDTVALDSLLVLNRTSTFLLTVSGDSMIEAGLMPRDIVLVDTSISPRQGDIVVACVDGQWTMKYFCRDKKGAICLEAANPKYPRLYPQEQLQIHSVVVSSVRRYRS